jgi:hypothetical protein
MTPLKVPSSLLYPRGDQFMREPEVALPTTESVRHDPLTGQPQLSPEQQTAMARAILRAGAKARGEPVADDDSSLPSDPVARQIVLAAKKRRAGCI